MQTILGNIATLDSAGFIPISQLPLLACRPDTRNVANLTATVAGVGSQTIPFGPAIIAGTYTFKTQITGAGPVTGNPFAYIVETPAATALSKINKYGTATTLIAAATEMARWTKSGGTAKTFTDTDVTPETDTIAIAAHGYTTGWAMTLTSTGTPPAPLAAGTVYYVISVSAGVIKLATSYENAILGVAIDLTDAGDIGATNTLTPASLISTDVSPVLTYGSTFNLAEGDIIRALGVNASQLFKVDAATSAVITVISWLERVG